MHNTEGKKKIIEKQGISKTMETMISKRCVGGLVCADVLSEPTP